MKEAEEMERRRAETAEDSMKLSPEDQDNLLRVRYIVGMAYFSHFLLFFLH